MSITRAFNKHTGVYYAYDVQYVWSEEKQKKVPIRRCIGKFDPETNEIIPNGKRGPKPVLDSFTVEKGQSADTTEVIRNDSDNRSVNNKELVSAITDGFQQVNSTLQEILGYMKQIIELSRND